MKRLILVCFVVLFAGSAMASELERVDKLSPDEKAMLAVARKEVDEAKLCLENVKDKIAAAHKMSSGSWPEWKRWYVIEGDYIMLRYQSFMSDYLLDTDVFTYTTEPHTLEMHGEISPDGR